MNKLWFIILSILVLVLAACGIQEVDGSRVIKTQDYNVSGYNKLIIKGQGIVTVIQDNQEGVTIETDDNLLQHLIVTQEDDTLEIKRQDNVSLDPSRDIHITVHINTLQAIELSDFVDLESDSITTDSLNLKLNGSGRIEIANLSTDSLTVNMDEVSQATIAGEINTLQLTQDKFSKFNGNYLSTTSVTANLLKNSEAVVWVTDSLAADVDGLASLSYYGNPPTTQTNIAPTAKFESLGIK